MFFSWSFVGVTRAILLFIARDTDCCFSQCTTDNWSSAQEKIMLSGNLYLKICAKISGKSSPQVLFGREGESAGLSAFSNFGLPVTLTFLKEQKSVKVRDFTSQFICIQFLPAAKPAGQ